MEFLWLILILPIIEPMVMFWNALAFGLGFWIGRRRRRKSGLRQSHVITDSKGNTLVVAMVLIFFLALTASAFAAEPAYTAADRPEFSAMYLGADKDRTGIHTLAAPDGLLDYEVNLTGLRAEAIVGVRVEANNGDLWEVPINAARNWHVAIERDGLATNARIFISPCDKIRCGREPAAYPKSIKVIVRYESGVVESIATGIPPPLPLSLPVDPPQNPTPYATTQPPPGVVNGTLLLHISLDQTQAVYCNTEMLAPTYRVKCWVAAGSTPPPVPPKIPQ